MVKIDELSFHKSGCLRGIASRRGLKTAKQYYLLSSPTWLWLFRFRVIFGAPFAVLLESFNVIFINSRFVIIHIDAFDDVGSATLSSIFSFSTFIAVAEYSIRYIKVNLFCKETIQSDKVVF